MFSRIRQFALYKHVQALGKRYERLLVPAFLLVGFVVDIVTFRTLSPSTTFIVTGVYASLAALAIVYANVYDARSQPPASLFLRYLRLSTGAITQFTFGALLSAAFLFYWFSGSFAVSWPLMVVLVALMVSAEAFRKVYLRPGVQLAVFSFVLCSYFSLLFPFVFRTLSPAAFVLGGGLGACVVLFLIAVMVRLGSVIDRAAKWLALVPLAIVAGMVGLYYASVIPPIPLFIRDAGVYHDLTGTAGDYTLVGEHEGFFASLFPGQKLLADTDGRLYVYSAIFAPTDLVATIFHRWERYDEARGEWVTLARPSFVIRGGREGGFRGYTFKTNVTPGRWRVSVETVRGQVLGRVRFVAQ